MYFLFRDTVVVFDWLVLVERDTSEIADMECCGTDGGILEVEFSGRAGSVILTGAGSS